MPLFDAAYPNRIVDQNSQTCTPLDWRPLSPIGQRVTAAQIPQAMANGWLVDLQCQWSQFNGTDWVVRVETLDPDSGDVTAVEYSVMTDAAVRRQYSLGA